MMPYPPLTIRELHDLTVEEAWSLLDAALEALNEKDVTRVDVVYHLSRNGWID